MPLRFTPSPPLPPLHAVSTPDEFKITIDRRIDGRRCIYSPERDLERDSFRNIVEDIASGELEYVTRVLCLNEDDGTCRNVTEDIARAVFAELCSTGDDPPHQLRDFLHAQLGPLTIETEFAAVADVG